MIKGKKTIPETLILAEIYNHVEGCMNDLHSLFWYFVAYKYSITINAIINAKNDNVQE